MAKVETREFHFDSLKWLLVVALVAAGVVGNSYYSDVAVLYRVLGLVLGGVVAIFIALNTSKGHALWNILRDAQQEFRRVVWPSRQEVHQTTLIVVAVVVVMALILWGLDSLLGWLAAMIIG